MSDPNGYSHGDVEKLARVIDPEAWAAHDRAEQTKARYDASITAATNALSAGYRDCKEP